MKTQYLVIEEHKHVPEHAEMKDGILYLSREFETCIHLCACGCKSQTVTPLDPKRGWILTESFGKPTLRPSIGNQQMPCKSHYWVTEGEIVWC